MRGEFIGVWNETWAGIWTPVAEHEGAPSDLFCELYREVNTFLAAPLSIEDLAEAIESPELGRSAFERIAGVHFASEHKLVLFMEAVSAVLEDLGGDPLANHYFRQLESFVERFSLRYDLRRPCTLCPTLPGIFASLVRNLRLLASQDAHLDSLMKEFESAVRDLRHDSSEGRIKTCIQKQVNLLEAFGSACPGVTNSELGAICNQVSSWPHATIRESLKKVYGFASDYPGIRHGGNPASALRGIDMRDLVAVSVLLAGFTPYLSHELNIEGVFGAGGGN